jgi:prepilin-type N-terminal cleavage/methylation domain-containing protein
VGIQRYISKHKLNLNLAKGTAMLQHIRAKQQGFTIIEVMIVLVVAAVILLIVFLAVPALQRNSRNTQRKQAISNFAAAVNEWANNNNGVLPSTSANLTTANTGVNALANLPSLITAPAAVTAASTSVANTSTTSTILYVPGTICAANGTATSTGASSRQFTVLYQLETGGSSSSPQCQAS